MRSVIIIVGFAASIACDPEDLAAPALDRSQLQRERFDRALDDMASQHAIPLYGTFTASGPCVIDGDVPQDLLAEGEARWADPIALLDFDLTWIAEGAPAIASRAIIARLELGTLRADGSTAFVEPSEGLMFLARMERFPAELPSVTCDGTLYDGGGYLPYTFFHHPRFEPGYSVDEIQAKAQAAYDAFDYDTGEESWTYLTVRTDGDGPPT